MMISDVVKFVKSTTFIKIISPVIVVILVVILWGPSISIGFICAYILELLIRSIVHNFPGFLGYSGYFFMFLVLTISFLGIFKMIFKLEKNHKPNIFDHIRLCGLLYIADIYSVSTFLEISGKHLKEYAMESWSQFGSLLGAVLLSSVILANIIAIILMRRRREDMNYKLSFKNILLGVIIPVLILVIWAIMMLKIYSDTPKVSIVESPSPLPIIVNDQKAVELPRINVPITLIPVK